MLCTCRQNGQRSPSFAFRSTTSQFCRVGFAEILSRWTAGHRANFNNQKAERQELLQLSTATNLRKLAEYWADQQKHLESLEAERLTEDI